MSYELSWLVPGRAVYVGLYDATTAEELHEESAQIVELLDRGEGPLVHQFIDATMLEAFPSNVEQLNLAMVDALQHPRLGWTILVTSNRMLKYLGAMVTGLSNARYRSFTTLEDGLGFLNQVDSTLPPLLAQQDSDG